MPDEIDLSAGFVDTPTPRRGKSSRLNDLISFAQDHSLTVGSTTGGRHNVGSKHYTGNAIDIKGSGGFDDSKVNLLKQAASERGLLVRDERRKPPKQKVWGGPHIHIEVADGVQGIDLSAGLNDDPLNLNAGLIDGAPSLTAPQTVSPSTVTTTRKRGSFEGLTGGANAQPPASISDLRRSDDSIRPIVRKPRTLADDLTALPGIHQIVNLLPEEDRQNFVEGATGAIAGTGKQLANTQNLGMQITGMNQIPVLNRLKAIPETLTRASNQVAGRVAENQTLRPEPTTFAGKVRRGVGQGAGAATIELPKLITGARFLGAANLPVQGALSRADEGVPGLIKGAGMGLVYHYGGGLTGKYLGKVGNSLVWIAGPTAERMITDPNADLATALGESIPMGVFAGAGGAKKVKIKTRGGERDATPSDLKAIVEKRVEVVPPERMEDARTVEPEPAARSGQQVDRSSQETVQPEQYRDTTARDVPQRFQHLQFGEVEASPNQNGVGKGRVRVVDKDGAEHVIQKTSAGGRGNERAIPVKPVEESVTQSELKVAAPKVERAATEGVGGDISKDIPAPSITSVRKDMLKADRVELDLPELPTPERKAWQTTLDNAKEKQIDQRASLLADEVLKRPRGLSDEESAGLVLRSQQIKNEHGRVMREIGEAVDPDVIAAKRNEADALQGEFDKLSAATKASGTQNARALAAHKLTINQDFDLVSVLQRAKAAKGKELSPEERTKFEGMTRQIEELQTRLARAEADGLAKSIQKDIERVRRQIKRGETKQVLDDEFASLKTEFAQARIEAKGVQASGLAGLDPEGKLTPIILKMARNRVKAGVVKAEDVVDHVYIAVKEHIDNVSKDDIRELLAGHNLERDPLPAIKTRLGKQEKELTRRLEEKDYSAPPKRKPVVYDREASNLKARVEQLKRQVDAEIKGNDSRIETALNLWKAGLLTGPRTHLRNIGGTAAFQAFEEAARVPGSIADLLTSTVTKRRALSGPSPVAVARSSYEAATKGVREAAQIIRYGATAEELKIIDRPREANSGSKIIDTYINTVFRTLGAEDKIFRTYAYKRSIIEQAKLRAKTEGKSAKELEENPTAEMVSQGLLDAEVATFNNENVAAKGVTWAREHSGLAGKVAIDLVVPFKRTPANIMVRLLESTPLGVVKGAGQLVKAGVNKKFTFEDQRKFSQTIGRSVTGSSLIVLGWKLAAAGLATGLYEEDRGDREVQKASGRSPMAVKIGNAWHQIGSFSPIGNLIAIGAALYREKNRPPKEGEDPPNLPAAVIPIAARTMMEQPMLKGVSGVADAIKEPGSRGTTLIGRTLGSAIPTIVSDVGALTDDRRREARTIKDRIITRIPIVRRSLPEDVDVFGRPLESRRTGVVDPTLSTTANDEPFIKELIRLDVGIVKTNRKSGEDEAKYREKILAQGKEIAKELARLTDSVAYKLASDDDKREMIKDKVTQVRKAVNQFLETGGTRKPRERREARPTRYRYSQ